MNKIAIIIQREYLSRVRKVSFVVMTIVGPLLLLILVAAPHLISFLDKKDDINKILIFDKKERFNEIFDKSLKYIFYFNTSDSLEYYRTNIRKTEFDAVVSIPENLESTGVSVYSKIQANYALNTYIKSVVSDYVRTNKLKKYGIPDSLFNVESSEIPVRTFKVYGENDEKPDNSEAGMIIGFICAFVIYTFIFMYGAQVLRSVVEEKTSRVVEILISSVKPFQLMAGKIIGVALVALTQFLLWAVLSGIILLGTSIFFADFNASEISPEMYSNSPFSNQGNQMNLSAGISFFAGNINWSGIFISFFAYFMLGYLLYGSLFAAIGSVVDSETDSQQFTLPVTIPLLLSLIAAQPIVENPGGGIAFWFSIFPLTSPVIMPLRICLDSYNLWEVILSITLLFAFLCGAIWLAAKIYRTNILMFGKKVTYKEIYKRLKF